MAYVEVNPTGTDFINQGSSLQWNSILLENLTGDIYVSLLKSIIGRDVADKPKKSSENKTMEKQLQMMLFQRFQVSWYSSCICNILANYV